MADLFAGNGLQAIPTILRTLPLNFGPIGWQNVKNAWRSANLSKSIAGILDENRTFSQTTHATYQNVLFCMPGKVPGAISICDVKRPTRWKQSS